MNNNRVLPFVAQIMVMAIVISVILLFVGIGVLVLIHVCIVGRALRRGMIIARSNDNSGNSSGISREDLQRLPCFDYKTGDKEKGPIDCAVCLDGFQGGDKCRLLPICKHSFHAQCVDSWLLKAPICPICRTSVCLSKVAEGGCSHLGEVGFELRVTQPVTVGFPVIPDVLTPTSPMDRSHGAISPAHVGVQSSSAVEMASGS
ncbi:hypothetical protein AMTRI_Chr10g6370 [Amborella trichopoda]